jgi:secreted trypsin-like serine protease
MLCGSWTGEAGTTGACIGDSGGPLITKGSYGYSQIGKIWLDKSQCMFSLSLQ